MVFLYIFFRYLYKNVHFTHYLIKVFLVCEFHFGQLYVLMTKTTGWTHAEAPGPPCAYRGIQGGSWPSRTRFRAADAPSSRATDPHALAHLQRETCAATWVVRPPPPRVRRPDTACTRPPDAGPQQLCGTHTTGRPLGLGRPAPSAPASERRGRQQVSRTGAGRGLRAASRQRLGGGGGGAPDARATEV